MSQWVSMWFSQCMRSIRETMGEWGREGQSNSKGLYNHIYNIYIGLCSCVCYLWGSTNLLHGFLGLASCWVSVKMGRCLRRINKRTCGGWQEWRRVGEEESRGRGNIFICVLLKARSQPLSWFPHIEIDPSRSGMYATTITTTTIPRQIFSSKTSH